MDGSVFHVEKRNRSLFLITKFIQVACCNDA